MDVQSRFINLRAMGIALIFEVFFYTIFALLHWQFDGIVALINGGNTQESDPTYVMLSGVYSCMVLLLIVAGGSVYAVMSRRSGYPKPLLILLGSGLVSAIIVAYGTTIEMVLTGKLELGSKPYTIAGQTSIASLEFLWVWLSNLMIGFVLSLIGGVLVLPFTPKGTVAVPESPFPMS